MAVTKVAKLESDFLKQRPCRPPASDFQFELAAAYLLGQVVELVIHGALVTAIRSDMHPPARTFRNIIVSHNGTSILESMPTISHLMLASIMSLIDSGSPAGDPRHSGSLAFVSR